jgi:methionine aminopeptidase
MYEAKMIQAGQIALEVRKYVMSIIKKDVPLLEIVKK